MGNKCNGEGRGGGVFKWTRKDMNKKYLVLIHSFTNSSQYLQLVVKLTLKDGCVDWAA